MKRFMRSGAGGPGAHVDAIETDPDFLVSMGSKTYPIQESRAGEASFSLEDIVHAQKVQAQVRAEWVEIAETSKDLYREIFDKSQATLSLNIKSKSRAKIVRAAYRYCLRQSVVEPALDDASLVAAVRRLEAFYSQVNTLEAGSTKLDSSHQGYQRLGLYLESQGVIVYGPSNGRYQPRKGRAAHLSKLEKHWRPKILSQINSRTPLMEECLISMALLGCRPSEAKGISIASLDDGQVQLTVISGKLPRAEMKQPPCRGAIYSFSRWTEKLWRLGNREGEAPTFPFADITYQKIKNCLIYASGQVFPKLHPPVNSSDFRNQLASDLKLAQFAPTDIALLISEQI